MEQALKQQAIEEQATKTRIQNEESTTQAYLERHTQRALAHNVV